jgi:hypothetical protein
MLGAFLTLAYLVISIANFANFDGWVRVADLFKAKQHLTGTISIIESLLFTLLFLYMGFTLFSLHKNPTC